MNFGGSGAGSYGQHPMGQAMQQMPMGMTPATAQQRMMMQQGMRQHPGFPGHPGMQNMPLYPGAKNPMDVMKMWPTEWKAQLQQERNQEKKKQLMMKFSAQFEEMARKQHMHHQGMMNAQGMMAGHSAGGMMMGQHGAVPGGMPGMMNPAMMNKSMMPQSAAAAQAMQMRMHGQAPGQTGPGSVQSMIPPSATPQPSSVSQMPSVPGMSVPSPGAMLSQHPGQSPQVINPATPQNPASVQPGSIEAIPPSQHDEEYKKMLEKLKKYRDPLKKIIERCILDKRPLPKAIDKLLEVIEDKRTVPKDLLSKLEKNTLQVMETQSIISPLLEEFKRTSDSDSQKLNNKSIVLVRGSPQSSPEKKIHLTPFASLSHMFIRIPDCVEEHLKNVDNSLKRKSSEEVAVPPKKIKEDDLLKEMPAEKLEVECMFGKGGKKWEMSEAAAQELHSIPWQIDPDSVPPSYKCPDVTISIESQILLMPPLRVQIPGSYPDKNPVVQFDRSFPRSGHLTAAGKLNAQLASLFERQLSMSTCRSITTIYESYKIACQELLRLTSPQHNLLNVKQFRQKLVA